MNYTLLITTAFILINPFSLVMLSGATGEVGQVGVEDAVFAQNISGLLPEYKDQGLIGSEGGVIYIENDKGEEIAFLRLDPGFLNNQVLVTLQEEAYEAPPGRYDYLKEYDDEIVTQIGPKVRVTFPYSAINVTSTEELSLAIYPYEDVYERTAQNLYEIQISVGGGQFYFTRRLYDFTLTAEGPAGRPIFTSGSYYGIPPFSDISNPPETYKMIAQPLSITRPQ